MISVVIIISLSIPAPYLDNDKKKPKRKLSAMQACNRATFLIESEHAIDSRLVGPPKSHKTFCHRSIIRSDPVPLFGRAPAWSDYPTPTELFTCGRVPRYESYVTSLCDIPPSSLGGGGGGLKLTFTLRKPSPTASRNCDVSLYVRPSRLFASFT